MIKNSFLYQTVTGIRLYVDVSRASVCIIATLQRKWLNVKKFDFYIHCTESRKQKVKYVLIVYQFYHEYMIVNNFTTCAGFSYSFSEFIDII